jgi:hypothetical protein
MKGYVTFVSALVAVAATSAFGLAESRLSAFGKLPLSFEPNVGQSGLAARFVAHASGATFYFTPSGITSAEFRMKLLSGNPAPEIVGIDRLAGKSNYFIGNDPAKWKKDVPQFARVKYAGVYPGVDLIFRGSQRQLEYDFVVAPGSDPRRIRFAFEGASRLRIDKEGALVVRTKGGNEIRQHRPVIYQETGGKRRELVGGYVMNGRGEVGFKVATYDRNRPLVIDPVLTYSTYLGGGTAAPRSPADNGAQAIAVDSSGNMYVTGFTGTVDFPTANPEQPAYGGGLYDVFVTKLDRSGSTVIYSTYLGGMNAEKAFAIAVDSAGSAYITGFTQSPNFPVTPTAFQPISTTGILPGNSSDAFVTKLSPAGNALVYSTYLGGSTNAENAFGIAVDSSGCAYVTGETASIDFPTKNAYQPSLAGSGFLRFNAFVTKLSADGATLVYSTYLGGGVDEGFGIAVDSAGSAYVTGYTYSSSFPTQNPLQANLAGDADIFVTKFSPAGNTLVYSTYLGGSNLDVAFGIAVDSSGNAYITGKTRSNDFPTANAFQPVFGGGDADAFVAKLNPAGSALVYSTYLGGSGSEGNLSRITLDSAGEAYIVGSTDSKDFPIANAIQSAKAGPGDNAFVTKLNAAGNGMVYSTYLGGNSLNLGFGIAVDASGTAYIAGQTWSTNFPMMNPFQGNLLGTDDAFIAKIAEPPPVRLNAVVSRMTHGSAGTFDVDLPLTGSPGIECRSGGANGDYTIVFIFANTLVSVQRASVTSGTGTVRNSGIGNDAHQYIVDLTGVTNAQYVTATLANVIDSQGNGSASVAATMGVLVGDVNGSGRVDSTDVFQVRQQTLQNANVSNFRMDVDVSGRIDSTDVFLVRQQTLTSLP